MISTDDDGARLKPKYPYSFYLMVAGYHLVASYKITSIWVLYIYIYIYTINVMKSR